DQIASELQRLSDIEAIKQLRAKHVRCIDTKEWDLWVKEVLAEDVETLTDGGHIVGRDNVVASISKTLAQAVTMHRIHIGEVWLTGPNTASAKWPMDDYVEMTVKGAPFVLRGSGYYHEDYVRTENGWRIRRSQLVRLKVETQRGEPKAP